MISTKFEPMVHFKNTSLKSNGKNTAGNSTPLVSPPTWVSDPDLFTSDTHFSEMCQALGVAQGE